ncbi:hypothetical protein Lser_V15G24885 [Lactuca serriola]
MEEITCGEKVLLSGGTDGPPTTPSGTRKDRIVLAQLNVTRDTTKFVNGAFVGARDVFEFDPGVRIGSDLQFFSCYQVSSTQFIQLKDVEEGAGKVPPPVLVLHGHFGGSVGDHRRYDAFTLGGPYSLRGYNRGRISAARSILELATELRIPVKKSYVYGFAEIGLDLGSSMEVQRRIAHGFSYGVGAKVGLVSAEYSVKHNSGTGALFFRFGDS